MNIIVINIVSLKDDNNFKNHKEKKEKLTDVNKTVRLNLYKKYYCITIYNYTTNIIIGLVLVCNIASYKKKDFLGINFIYLS